MKWGFLDDDSGYFYCIIYTDDAVGRGSAAAAAECGGTGALRDSIRRRVVFCAECVPELVCRGAAGVPGGYGLRYRRGVREP